ncbi:heat-shock protein Hsp20 [Variovorax sp. KBW07]|jgi:HSP20 family protein|uniref:Hsp20/alpha crystallin family protein n=1 Tax=unclassified Variovorax TaxID=663243 RepID=UPI000F5705E0|nr:MULTISPECIES: Hsp20/alpha crystallin family protein [unclassified Variovorax]RQO59393.1 heat-shock protein Hsp20 [Variovorax sp. KBW07]RSZ44302.1 Hsp20 family protein [Variovorax sp. 553]RSZ45041.1 Hsp20 family protein [Variovorax sp. 679]
MYRSFFPRDMLAEMDRLQRDMQQAFDLSPTIRGYGSNGFPALNVGATPQALEIFAFAPGVDPATLEINLERGLMTIAGERKSLLPDAQAKSAVHINERFEGPFRRVLTLPDDADPEAVEARLRDGVLRITVRRRASAQPRRIAVQ